MQECSISLQPAMILNDPLLQPCSGMHSLYKWVLPHVIQGVLTVEINSNYNLKAVERIAVCNVNGVEME